jgi:hypothetical protein
MGTVLVAQFLPPSATPADGHTHENIPKWTISWSDAPRSRHRYPGNRAVEQQFAYATQFAREGWR